MAFNLGGFIRGLAAGLPGYVQGAETARKGNWDDVQQFNQGRAGQLQNLWTQATWQPNLDMTRDAAINSEAGMLGGMMNLQKDLDAFPGQRALAQALSWALTHGMGRDIASSQWGAVVDPMADKSRTGPKYANPGDVGAGQPQGQPQGQAFPGYDPGTGALIQAIMRYGYPGMPYGMPFANPYGMPNGMPRTGGGAGTVPPAM